MIDLLALSIIISVVIFFASVSIVFVKVALTKPRLIRNANSSGFDTTYNWNAIMGIIGNCTGLAGGIFIISNALVAIATGEWQIDPRSLALLVVAFAVLLVQSFDRFVTKLLR